MKTIRNISFILRQEFRKKSYFKQVLYSYIAVSCVTFLIFSVILLTIIQNQHYDSMKEINDQNIVQANSFHDSSLADIASYGYIMLDNADVCRLLYSGNFDINDAISSRDVYDRIKQISSMVVSVDLINFSTKTALTKQNRISLSQFADQELLTYLSGLEPGHSVVFWHPRKSYVNGIYREPQRVLSLIYYMNAGGALVINIDYDAYISQTNLNRNNDNMEMIILNQNDYVMAATDSELFMQDFSKNPILKEIKNMPYSSGSFERSGEDGRQTVSFRYQAKMGITYISVLDMGKGYEQSRLFGLTLRYSMVYILATLLLSFLSSWLIYRPVRRLKKTISGKEESPEAGMKNAQANDFEFLESVYKNLIVKNTVLSKVKKSYEEGREQKILHILLEQSNPQFFVAETDLKELDGKFAYLNYLVFVIHVDMKDTPPREGMDIPLIKFVITNVAEELFGRTIKLKGIETISSRLIFIANFEQYNPDTFRTAAEELRKFFDKMGLFSLSLGFGSPVTELDNLASSYEDAKTALSNGMLYENGCIQFFEDLRLANPNEQKYPHEADVKMIGALKSLNIDAADTAVDIFFERIRNYRYDQIYRDIQQLDASLQRFEYHNQLPAHMAERDQDLNLLKPRTLEELKAGIRKRCHMDIRTMLEIKLHNYSKDKLIAKVRRIVEENIYNPNLSVVMIAEQVDLSVNYLRNIYKENSGESLSSYISGRKLSIICELLTGTELSIQEISDKLGFATKNYFFTFFKKHMDMTPIQYKKSCAKPPE